MFLKIKKFTSKSEYKDYKGLNGFTIPKNAIVEVLPGSTSNVGDIIMRTDNDKQPFITRIRRGSDGPDDGSPWGNLLGSYNFRHWLHKTVQDFK
jgi:hypothetical protein